IAPSAPHALHMPSHIFVRLALWDESIDSNLASAGTAREWVARAHPGATAFDELHALDYLAYAYLQEGRDREAAQVGEAVAGVRGGGRRGRGPPPRLGRAGGGGRAAPWSAATGRRAPRSSAAPPISRGTSSSARRRSRSSRAPWAGRGEVISPARARGWRGSR